MKTLHISAGGNGSRISAYCSTIGPGTPKHLLPLPAPGGTILGEILFNSGSYFDQSIVWTNSGNHSLIQTSTQTLGANIRYCEDTDLTGPLGPLVRSLLSGESRTYGCAGDYYCNFNWSDFESFHDSHGSPISILVAKSVPTLQGAKFNLNESGVINSWERVEHTTFNDRINIGCYIVDPDQRVLSMLASMNRHKEDLFFDGFIPKGLVYGYDPQNTGFNINIPEVYHRLLETLNNPT